MKTLKCVCRVVHLSTINILNENGVNMRTIMQFKCRTTAQIPFLYHSQTSHPVGGRREESRGARYAG